MQKFLINDFEGPLDLLLHLIKQSKMDIYDIKIVEITEQYINFINDMEEKNLNVASEYLVMASELIEMKSRFLLPKKQVEEESEYEENPEEELSKRLLEYKKIKESTPIFKKLEENRVAYHTKAPEKKEEISNVAVNNDGSVTVNDLLDALSNILKRQRYAKPTLTKVTKKELSVKDRVYNIRKILKTKKKAKFEELFDNYTKPYVVVTFLSILEMAKNNEVIIKQEGNFDNIYLELVGEINE